MSNIDNIKNKLVAEAEEKISNIESESQKKAEQVKNELIEQAEAEKNVILERAKKEADRNFKRISENSEIRIRDKRISEYQKLIDRIFGLALDKLNSQTDEEYLSSIEHAIEGIDRKNLLLRVPENRIEAVKNAKLDVELDEKNFVQSGFLLSSDNMNYNFVYADILKDKREELGAEILKLVIDR